MGTEHFTHINDTTMKYTTMAQAKRQHEYLGLSGKFKIRYPQEVVFPDMDTGRMDELYLTDEDILINLEEESTDIGPKTFKKYNKYNKFIRYIYNKEVYHASICHKDPKKKFICYKAGPSNYIKIDCIHFPQKELWEKYENVINKVEQKEELTDMEALDMAFVCKFIAPQHKEFVIDHMTKSFEASIIKDKRLRMDVAVIINAMIVKHVSSEAKQKEFKERINMRQYENEIQKIVYEEYGAEIRKELEAQKQESKNEIEKAKQETKEAKQENKELKIIHKEYKNKIKQLTQIKDLNSSEAKNIINSMMLL